MYADFFKNNRPRYNNPTYQSNLVQSSMLFPFNKYDIVKYQYQSQRPTENTAIKGGKVDSGSANAVGNNGLGSNSMSSQAVEANQSRRNQSGLGNAKTYETIDSYRNMSTSTVLPERYLQRRSKSHLSSYGSSSLTHLPNLSDRQVFTHQQKQFNIVNLCPTQYEPGIKMYPKFRNEIKQDQPNQMRNAFIHGKPEVGLAYAKKEDNSKGYRQFLENQDWVGKTGKSSLYRSVQKSKKELNPESK